MRDSEGNFHRSIRAARLISARAAIVATLTAASALGAQTPECTAPDTAGKWAQVSRAWADESHVHWLNDALRGVLLEMETRDQAIRVNFGTRFTDTVYLGQLHAVDTVLAVQLESIIEKFGLPTKSMVGTKGVSAAMLVAQHNGWLQAGVLSLAENAAPGEVSGEAIAMMQDRYRVAKGLRQRYGTQFGSDDGGPFKLRPVDDPAHLEGRRAAAGLMPMPDYVCLLEANGMKVDRTSLIQSLRPSRP